jgi:hypothetical protein
MKHINDEAEFNELTLHKILKLSDGFRDEQGKKIMFKRTQRSSNTVRMKEGRYMLNFIDKQLRLVIEKSLFQISVDGNVVVNQQTKSNLVRSMTLHRILWILAKAEIAKNEIQERGIQNPRMVYPPDIMAYI